MRFDPALIDVVGLYMNPRERVLVLSCPSKGSPHTAALTPWTRAGAPGSDRGSSGAATLLAALRLSATTADSGLTDAVLGKLSPAVEAAPVTDPVILRLLRFTLCQAALSTFLSVGLAILVASALARRIQLPGGCICLA